MLFYAFLLFYQKDIQVVKLALRSTFRQITIIFALFSSNLYKHFLLNSFHI